MSSTAPAPTVIVVTAPKSVALALLLTFFFGPLGMLYATTLGALVMIGVSLVVGIVTLGFGLLVTWPICMIWAAIATNRHNARLSTTPRAVTA